MMIDGVKIVELKTHQDERGFFREIFRFPEHYQDVEVGQLSHSLINNGVIKGWHGHVYQYQWNYIVSGQLKVWLYDNREKSGTWKNSIEFNAGAKDKPIAYFFPPGVLHGYKCINGPAQIIYVTSGIYNLEDELRIDLNDKNINISI